MTIYSGSCLRVNLTDHEIRRSPTPDHGIGGRTWNSMTLLQELKPGVDPLGPDNILCIAVGPLTGSEFIASCRFIASAKSPLTGYLGDSGARGFFAPELRWAGHDQIVLTGASDRWVYLWIDNDTVELRDASHLVGLDITETTTQLRSELHDPDLQVAAIGPAGEHLVRCAIISCNLARAAGRTGMGAVMGSKETQSHRRARRYAGQARRSGEIPASVPSIQGQHRRASRVRRPPPVRNHTHHGLSGQDGGAARVPLPQRCLRGPRKSQC